MDKETVNKLIINSLIKKGYKLEEVDQDFLNDMAEIMYKQLALCNVSCSLPSKEEIHIEAEKYQDKQLNDPLALTYDAFVEGCNYVIKKQK